MSIDRKTIQLASRRFRVAASNLYNCDFADYNIMIGRLVSCIESEPLIEEFINQCIEIADFQPEYLSKELDTVRGCWSNTFENYSDDKIQAAFVYLLLKAMLAENKDIAKSYGAGYARSKHFQDWADAFTKRFVSTLIDVINGHLEECLILSGVEEGQTPTVSVHGNQTQVNIADHGSHVEALVSNSYECKELGSYLDDYLSELKCALEPIEYEEA